MADALKGPVILMLWDAEGCDGLAAPLRAGAWDVKAVSQAVGVRMKDLWAAGPAAVVISLRRLPSHGPQGLDADCGLHGGPPVRGELVDSRPQLSIAYHGGHGEL